MAKFYSPSVCAFYDSAIHGAALPPDAMPITDAEHQALWEAQANGKVIRLAGESLVVDDAPPPAFEEQLASLRCKRDRRLRESDFTQIPDAPLSTEARAAWAVYRQALRDLPELYADDPAGVVWPTPPNAETDHAD